MKDIGNSLTCPECGALLKKQKNITALPLKTVLNNRFLIGRVLGNPGGFGITYLAWDMLLETTVAIKEFLPLSSVSRDSTNTAVHANSKKDQINFNQGLQIFLKEAKTLAQYSHPNIVRIRDYFPSNNTAYLVMEYHQGLPLDQVVALAGGRLSENRALNIILPILDGLKDVHSKGFLHRDIKPQNIYLTNKGVPLLLDFGASRFAIANNTQTLTVMLSAGYAPFEQYHKKGNQGIWSDIYSIGATLYFMTTGTMPVDALERQQNDDILSPIKCNPSLSESFSHAVLKAMSVNPQLRHVSIDALKNDLMLRPNNLPQNSQKTMVSKTTHLAPILPLKTPPERQSVIIQYEQKKNSLGLGRILFYVGLVFVLWSGWHAFQAPKNTPPTPLVVASEPIETEQFIVSEDILNDDYVEMIEPFELEPEQEIALDPVTINTTFPSPPKMQNKQNLRFSEQKPIPAPPPMHKATAVAACRYKRPHSRCEIDFPHGREIGLCLPGKERQLVCLPHSPPPRLPSKPPIHR